MGDKLNDRIRDIDKQDSDGKTKLIRAAARGDTAECQRLIAAGARKNISATA